MSIVIVRSPKLKPESKRITQLWIICLSCNWLLVNIFPNDAENNMLGLLTLKPLLTVQRNKLGPVLQRAGLHGKLLKAIQSVCKCVKSCVRAND